MTYLLADGLTLQQTLLSGVSWIFAPAGILIAVIVFIARGITVTKTAMEAGKAYRDANRSGREVKNLTGELKILENNPQAQERATAKALEVEQVTNQERVRRTAARSLLQEFRGQAITLWIPILVGLISIVGLLSPWDSRLSPVPWVRQTVGFRYVPLTLPPEVKREPVKLDHLASKQEVADLKARIAQLEADHTPATMSEQVAKTRRDLDELAKKLQDGLQQVQARPIAATPDTTPAPQAAIPGLGARPPESARPPENTRSEATMRSTFVPQQSSDIRIITPERSPSGREMAPAQRIRIP